MEGGANVVIEAVRSGVPVLASRIDGNVGLLGADYDGYFPVGDAAALAALMRRFVADAGVRRPPARAVRRARAAVPAGARAAGGARRWSFGLLPARIAGALRESALRFRIGFRHEPRNFRRVRPRRAPRRCASPASRTAAAAAARSRPACSPRSCARASAASCRKELMVGIETADDAAVYRLNDEQALIATTDFFMPIVDDPYDFGRIAATNAISDVYAMGGTPIMALALVGMPIDKLPVEQIGQIIRGGEAVCAEAGIPIAGGHTIDSVEPIYGLVVMGLVHPEQGAAQRRREGRATCSCWASRSASACCRRR